MNAELTPAEQRAWGLLAPILVKALTPKEPISTCDWSQKHVTLDRRFTKHPGAFDPMLNAYQRGLMNWFDNPYIRDITWMKAAQIGGTTVLANCIMSAIVNRPGPLLYVTSTQDIALSYSERELIPRFESCQPLRRLFPSNPDLFKKLEMHFKDCTLRLVGSNSAAGLASRPIQYLFGDELDKWPEDTNKETAAWGLAEARTLSYQHTCKRFAISTPTVETGAIHQRYLKGSQHKYFVPCPLCGHMQELVFEQVVWPDSLKDLLGYWDLEGVEKLAEYKCIKCEQLIPQHKKAWMVRNGEWVATNPKAARDHISAHISQLYSSEMSLGAAAKIFLQKKNSIPGLHDWKNNYEGKPWILNPATNEDSAIHEIQKISTQYVRGIIPIKPKFLLMTIDVQQMNYWWVIRAWCEGSISFLINYGSAISDEDLLVQANTEYEVMNTGERFTVFCGAMDSGFAAKRTKGVYDFCLRSNRRFFPFMGRTAAHGLTQPVRETTISWESRTLYLTQFLDPMFKEELYIHKIQKRKGPGWFLPQDLDGEYIAQLTDERLVEKKTDRGENEAVWVTKKNNHLGDCEKMQLVMAHIFSRRLERKQAAAPAEDPASEAR